LSKDKHQGIASIMFHNSYKSCCDILTNCWHHLYFRSLILLTLHIYELNKTKITIIATIDTGNGRLLTPNS